MAVRQLVTLTSLPSQEKEEDKHWWSLSFSFILGSEPGIWSGVACPSLVGLDTSSQTLPDTCLLGDLDPRKLTVSVTYHKQGHGFLRDPGRAGLADMLEVTLMTTQCHLPKRISIRV